MASHTAYPVYEFHTTLESYQLHKLNQMLVFLVKENEFYRSKLTGITLPLRSMDDLLQLPFTTKQELVDDQTQFPPYGKNHTYPIQSYARYHQTSGTSGRPLKVLDTKESWEWWETCWEEVFRSSGINKNDTVFLAFSFGPFIGFWGGFEAAKKIGAFVICAGSQTSKERLATMMENNATVLLCTPSYALHLAEVAEDMDLDLPNSSIKTIITAGEPGGSVPSIRRQIETAWGAKLYDHVGMTEMGAYGYSCQTQNGIHVNESQFIVEILNMETSEPVKHGEKGELVLTNLGRYGYPLIRYRTGDVVINHQEKCPCKNHFRFLPGGIIGRADDMVVIRGINIYPSSIEAIVREYPEIKEFRIIYYTSGDMDQIKVQFETTDDRVEKKLSSELRERVGLRIETEAVEPGVLPRFSMKAKRVMDQRNNRITI
ncbi:phenylacetate-CoA ligase [Bacillus thermophilus]|uniref:Phenylacetate-CoA ligase n=1 Tax=Siminovitchia thermophila TaxID=1245522 RepID=A0ABS2R3Q8_9BACI|nr:AMP-binding protein [Siminovitchia thermophila]MBM7714292.1 phenylacetate-CoA ligase [Siminovitchia thermophila]ONK22194.1 phenylacetate--CoA ligase [Bacillus sp. VT-16-64]